MSQVIDNSSGGVSNQKRRVTVDNGRKIWGTLKSTTCSAMSNVIGRLTTQSLSAKLTVKRKYKTNKSGSVQKWWFVVRGEKLDVEQLEQQWEAIATHTNWRLESLFRFEDKDIDATHVAATQQQLSCTQPIATPVVSQCDDVMETVTQGTQPINAQIVSQCNDTVESVRLLQSEDCHAVLDNGAGHCTTSEVNSLSPSSSFLEPLECPPQETQSH